MQYSVYKIWKANGFSNLVTSQELNHQAKIIVFDGKPKSDRWLPTPLKKSNPAGLHWDIFTIYGPSALVVTKEAKEALAPILDAGVYEILPVEHDGQTYYVVNVLEVVDCLNIQACEFRESGSIEKYAFNPKYFTRSLFKIPQEVTGSLLVATDAKRPEWGFKNLVERFNLKGITFRKIWQG